MPTPFELSDRLVDDVASLDPITATMVGISGHDHEWPDLSPEGHAARAEVLRGYRDGLARHLTHPDRQQRLAARVVTANLEERLARFEAGEHLRDLAHLDGSFQSIREVFDLQPRQDRASWEAACARLETVDRPLAGLWASLREGLARGLVQPERQVRSVLEQAQALSGEGSAWLRLVGEARHAMPAVADRVREAVDEGRRAVADFASRLTAEYLPRAAEDEAAGRERYVREADAHLGLTIDPEEVYRWGWEELARVRAELAGVARDIDPEAGSVEEVTRLLEGDPTRAAHSPQELVSFVEGRQRRALAELSGSHFDVAGEIAQVTVNLAPPGGALGAYYHPPSEDFSRPGSIWYSVGDETVFPLYQEVSTAYHEGFPGHHLQIGTSMVQRERLSRAQRLLVWYAGYGEGWALYAERLMQELGYLERPEYVFGMLANHAFRAARVVVDVGLHLRLPIPSHAPLHPGEQWTFDLAVDYMHRLGMQKPSYARSEVTRYLGWPGQAIAYKVGERHILELREAALAHVGGRLDLRELHRRLLGDGEMRLDLLREVVLHWDR